MKKKLKCTACLVLALLLTAVCGVSVLAVDPAQSDETPYRTYTYWEDSAAGGKKAVYVKPMYELKTVVSALDFSPAQPPELTDVAVGDDGSVYLLDGANSAVYVLDENYQLKDTLDSFTLDGEEISFADAQGIFADGSGMLYIADTENARVLVCKSTGEVQSELGLPDSELIPTGFKYRPTRVAVDSTGYVYIACDGSYYGAILYSPELEFLGFFGANSVQASVLDLLSSLWKRLTSNDIKRAADTLSLPFTMNDLYCGPDDFIYTTTGSSGTVHIQTGQVKLFNPGGKEVLGRGDFNFADTKIGLYYVTPLVQSMTGIAVDENGFFYVLDSTYGRVFWYDADCGLFSVFGGSASESNQNGAFTSPSGIELNGTDVLISDQKRGTLTVFSITEYGALVRGAQAITLQGDFAAAKDAWIEALAQDAANQMAYRGLAKACYDQGDNAGAMYYAKLGDDRETYAKAFEVRRTAFIERNIYLIVLAAVLVMIALVLLARRLRKRKSVEPRTGTLRAAFRIIPHPADGFAELCEKKRFSLPLAAALLVLLYVTTVLSDIGSGFSFAATDMQSYNAFYVLLSTVGLVLLFVFSNWLVCLLVGGLGNLREVFCVTCYCTLPLSFARVVRLAITHLMTPDEAAFLQIFMTVCTIYAAFLLIVGFIRLHDFSFGKFVATTAFTVVGMLILIFLIFLVLMLAQQVLTWLKTLYIEIRYR